MIWCVDDDNTIREIEVYTLLQTGFEARGFSDGSLQVVNEQGKTQARQRDAPPIR